MPSKMKRLRQLQKENSRLKHLVANVSLDKEMLQGFVRRKMCGLISAPASEMRRFTEADGLEIWSRKVSKSS